MKTVRKLTKSNRLTMHRKVKLGKHIRFVKDVERRLYETGYWKQEDYWDARSCGEVIDENL